MYVCMAVCVYVHGEGRFTGPNGDLYMVAYVCVFVCMYVCMYVWLYVCMYMERAASQGPMETYIC